MYAPFTQEEQKRGNNADEVLDGLWLGNSRASLDAQFLQRNRIHTVFNCTKDLPFHSLAQIRYRVPVDDNLEPAEIRNMELWSYEIVYKLDREYKKGNPILVHCAAGMQRSAASIALYLIATRNMTPDQAIEFLQSKRPIAFRPSANFRPALDAFYRAFQQIDL
jgi:dual specificity phosphatase 12